jgi:hypothetical protein
MTLLMKNLLSEDCIMGLWKIEEKFDTLLSMVTLDESEIDTLYHFKNDLRQLEWLSVRALLNNLTGKDSRIIYNEEHKPFLYDGSYNISISHSQNFTSILLSKHMKVGIDLEYMSHRINKIAHKFINRHESITCDKSLEQLHLYIHWCAKEALYKICDKKDINFKENLTIKPFDIDATGTIMGIHHNNDIYEEYVLNYLVMDNYVIVYCFK